MATVPDQLLRPWLEQQGDRLERIAQAHRIALRVQGGVITPRTVRFHLAVDPQVPLARLNELEEDLALVLGVPSARLARRDGVLAIEVPRPGAASVSLVRLQAGLPPLPPYSALLGRDTEGAPLVLRLGSSLPHILVAGTAGAGKTTLLRCILLSLALLHRSDDLRLVLADTQEHELAPFGPFPHLIGPVLRDVAATEKRLTWLVEELAWREESGVRLPRVVVAIDNVADLVHSGTVASELLTRLATRGQDFGFHLLLATHTPDMLPVLLRTNLPGRLVGRVTSAQEAVAASGIKGTGAERLSGRGAFLIVTPGDCSQFQAAYASTEEISVAGELLQADETPAARLPSLPQPVPLAPPRLFDRLRAAFARP